MVVIQTAKKNVVRHGYRPQIGHFQTHISVVWPTIFRGIFTKLIFLAIDAKHVAYFSEDTYESNACRVFFEGHIMWDPQIF